MQAVCLFLVLYVGTVQLPSSSPSPKYYRRRLDGSSNQAKFCDENFGEAWLAQWNKSATALCQPGSASGSTQLTCRQAYVKAVTSFFHQKLAPLSPQKLICSGMIALLYCCYQHESKHLCQVLASNICHVVDQCSACQQCDIQ